MGPSHYVEATNEGVAVFSRTSGAVASAASLDDFLGVPGDDVTDPQILFDQQTGRWYFAGLDFTSGSEQLLLGWSRTSDPSDLSNAGWCRFAIATPNFVDDFPKLGGDNGHILIGANRFSVVGDAFVTATIVVADKPPAGTGCAAPAFARFGTSASHLTISTGDDAFTPVPANTFNSSGGGYAVAAEQTSAGGGSRIDAWHAAGPPGSPSLVYDGGIAVGAYTVPANAPQSGSPNVLDTADTRLTQAVANLEPATGGEAVWTQHTVDGPGGRSVVRWYELLPGQLSVRQSGTVEEPSEFAFNGAISPTADGAHAMIDYNSSGPSTFPRVLARTRRASSPAGATSDATLLAASPGAHDDFSCSPCRWGDYAGATPDPVDPSLVWGTNEYSNGAAGTWTSRNFAIIAGGGLVASFNAAPGSISPGQTVSFDASASGDSGGASIARYEWDLDGDGSFETQTGLDPHASARYFIPATVTVRLRVIGSNGDSSVAERPVAVVNLSPVAALRESAPTAFVGRTVALDASASQDPDGQVTRFQWDRDGNGSFETDTGTAAFTRSRAFKSPRTVTLRVRVTDDRGATGEASVQLKIRKDVRACRAARKRVRTLRARVKRLARLARAAPTAKRARDLKRARRQLSRARARVRRIC